MVALSMSDVLAPADASHEDLRNKAIISANSYWYEHISTR